MLPKFSRGMMPTFALLSLFGICSSFRLSASTVTLQC
jgi:hypothetical protein